MPYIETWNDDRIKYQDTFTFVNVNGEYEPAYVSDIKEPSGEEEEEEESIFKIELLLDEQNGGKKYTSFSAPKSQMFLKMPERGCINFGRSVLVFNEGSTMESPGKYKKLMTGANTIVIDPFKAEKFKLGYAPIEGLDNFWVMKAILNNKYPSAIEALDDVISGKVLAKAFHKDFFFGIRARSNSIVLFNRQDIVGRVSIALKTVLLKKGAWPLAEALQEFGLSIKKVN